MARQIWKYPIQTVGEQELEISPGATILDIQLQDGDPYMWIIIDTEKKVEKRILRIYGTGHTLDDNANINNYLGTYQTKNGFVWHVFDITDSK